MHPAVWIYQTIPKIKHKEKSKIKVPNQRKAKASVKPVAEVHLGPGMQKKCQHRI